MKKKLTYRDKLLELARIYNVKEVHDYIKRRKNLTSGQLELILKKNKIIVPKDFQTNFYKENITKPISKFSKRIEEFKSENIKSLNKLTKKINDSRANYISLINNNLISIWRLSGNAGIAFLNMFPKLWETIYNFIGNLLTDLFNGIYNQKINTSKANKAIVGFFIIIGIVTVVISGITTFNNPNKLNKEVIVKKEKIDKKLETKVKKEKTNNKLKTKVKKEANTPKEQVKNDKLKKKKPEPKEKVAEVILPDLNLKTQTVLNLFKDVDYDLNTVRYEKRVQPIYFTQFPKDLDEIQSVQLKKETFIKIVLPSVVAENEKIL